MHTFIPKADVTRNTPSTHTIRPPKVNTGVHALALWPRTAMYHLSAINCRDRLQAGSHLLSTFRFDVNVYTAHFLFGTDRQFDLSSSVLNVFHSHRSFFLYC